MGSPKYHHFTRRYKWNSHFSWTISDVQKKKNNMKSRGQNAARCMWKCWSHFSLTIIRKWSGNKALRNEAKWNTRKSSFENRNEITAVTCSNGTVFFSYSAHTKGENIICEELLRGIGCWLTMTCIAGTRQCTQIESESKDLLKWMRRDKSLHKDTEMQRHFHLFLAHMT